MPPSPGKSTVSTAVAVPPLPRTSAATATCDRGATAARDPPYGRALAVPRSLAEVAGVLGAGAAATWNASTCRARACRRDRGCALVRQGEPSAARPAAQLTVSSLHGWLRRPRSVPSPKSRSPRDAQHPFLGDRHTEPPVAGEQPPATGGSV